MNNLINLDAAQPIPGIQGLGVKTASQRDGSALFAAVLMQQMNGIDGTNAGETDSAINPTADLAQGLAGNASLMKLLPALLAQSKDSKSAVHGNVQIEKTLDGSDANPALAIWIASILGAQTQPNAQNPALQLSGLATQLSGIGTEQGSALQALEQQFPGLVQALKGSQSSGAKPQADKLEVEANLDIKAPNLDAKTLNFETKAPSLGAQASNLAAQAPTLDTKVPALAAKAMNVDAKAPTIDGKAVNAAVKNDFDAALNAASALEPRKTDPSQTPAHLNPDTTLVDAKSSGISDKDKVEQKNLITNPAGNEGQQEPIQAGPSSRGAGANAQGQDNSQPDHSSSGSQTKKDPASSEQFQQPIGQASPSGATMNAIDQSSFAGAAQGTPHGGSANSTNHQASAEGQPLNLREAGSAVVVDAAPRIVHAARIMEAAGQAEMRVSVRTESSGTVDVRAVLDGNHISATLAAQHGGTRDWLMANMHELQTSLSRDDLNLKTFEVTDSALQNEGHGAGPRQQEQQQQHNSAYSRFTSEAHSTKASFDDIDLQENASRALSLLA